MLNDVCLEVNPVGKPDAVAPHVRFDERGRETGLQCYRARPRLYVRHEGASYQRVKVPPGKLTVHPGSYPDSGIEQSFR